MRLKHMLLLTLFVLFLLFAPLIWLKSTLTIHTPETAPKADAALIFGAVVRGSNITPLHKERLDAGRKLLDQGKVETIVVSNTPAASAVMRAYLMSNGVAEDAIEVDDQAVRTPDTCAHEHRKSKRRIMAVSQNFHLPRIALHCRYYGLDAVYVSANDLNRPKASLWTRVKVRSRRHLREAIFIWGTLLGAYPHQPKANS